MGKRKYDNESNEVAKKTKSEDISEVPENTDDDDEQPQNEKSNERHTKSVKANLFDVKHFRKELAEKQGQTMALTQFLQVCLNPDSDDDYMLRYLKVGGNSHEILRQITQDNKKNLTLATPAFHLFHLIILKVQSSLPHMIAITEEACRYFLNTFVPTIEIMISENSGHRHRKIVLNLLTSMVTLNSELGVEILNQLPLTPKNLQHVVEKPNYKEKDNVRTAFVHFMTSFLVDGHLPLVKALLEKQGLLSLVIPGLVQDEADAVLMFLNILKKNVIDNTLISKTLKLKTFSHQVLHNMFRIFTWKGPPESTNEHRDESRNEIMVLLSDIILTLFTSHKLGIYFLDPSLGTSDANKNQNLYKALQSLKRPWENENQCETVLQIVYKCPDLHRALINVIEQSFQPQHSQIWDRTTDFVMKLLDKLKPEEMVTRLTNLNPHQAANFVRFVTMPVPLLKLMHTGIGKDQTVSLYCIKVLVKMLQTLKKYMQILELDDTNAKFLELKNKLENFLPKHMPAPNVIVSLVNDVIDDKASMETQDYKLPTPNKSDALLSLIDLLLLYNYLYPASIETIEGTINMKKILDVSTTLTTGHISLLKFKIVSLWLMLDSSVLTLQNPMFKDLFLIMLDVFTNDEDNTWIEAKDTLHIFFKNTEIFEADEDEIHLMLYTLRNSKVNPISLIGDIIEHVLANGKELTEYIKNQMVNFEISDENSMTNLDKLFNDLMHGKNTEDSIFLESKIPSPFIVGCMQFIQSNKEAKKQLKSFLCLYVANLLHNNYSPELTEVLIGDSKLDIRSYITEWTIKPVPLPEATSNDITLKNISKSIIENADIPLTDIFPALLESSDEIDLNIMGVTYKMYITKPINSSDLYIWAKYLMFCAVRLTNMDKFSKEQQSKIVNYFEIIIALGKRNLMLNTCRNIILNMFKNSHFLKIYQPIDLNKNPSSVLATELLVDIIEKNRDLINYLSKKHFILKSYQQKTFNEIVKSFIKIKKRNVNSELTIKVLEIVGLSKDDDLQVLNHIFSADTELCLKEDKEPSLILEILRVLIEKYSKTISLELSQEVLKKSMDLYVTLLSLKDIIPNLTTLEESLIKYFENKPNQVSQVTEEHFKKFFYANTVRKTTSYLAYTILKFNNKFCDIFKEEINRPEILSQREITLPLGNALIDHNQFLLENKDILTTIYNEYKTNMNKFLEKPHKAGQVYLNSWKIIRKILIECMELKDCQKLFSKSHKFEIVDISHIHLMQTVFLKVCLSKDVLKAEHFINYFLSMLNTATLGIKENKDADILSALVLNICQVIEIYKTNENFQADQKEHFKKLTESGIWQNFCKAVLKDSLKVRTAEQENVTGPKLLSLLSSLVNLLYSNDHEDIVTLFDMVTSHSEFLNVMLSHHSPDVKARLLEFLYVLISTNKSVMKTPQIPVYLSAYRATRNPSDRLILKILHFYETNELPVNEYKPYIWGDSAANHYAIRKNRTTTLWSHPTPNQVMNLLDKEIIEKTVRHFPVNQKLEYNYELPLLNTNTSIKNYIHRTIHDSRPKLNAKDAEEAIKDLLLKDGYNEVLAKVRQTDIITISHEEDDEGIYDPCFLFPLLSHLLAPGSVASCFKLLRTGLLSVPVMGLSSHCPLMRAAAYHVLHRFCLLLETETRHKNDKLLLMDFVTTLRQSLSTAIDDAASEGELKDIKNPKLPAIGALYLARALLVVTSPSEPLYKPVNNYLIAKQFVDLTVVPDFLSLFHDSDVEAMDRRNWILDIIRDGTKSMIDVNVVFKTMCLKMIMDFFNTVLCDRKTKVKILGALNSIVSIPRSFEILVEGYGFMSWLHYMVRNIRKEDKLIVKETFILIKNMIHSMGVSIFAKYCAKFNANANSQSLSEFKVKSDLEYEILSIVYDLLPHTELLEFDDVVSYVKLYNLITKRSIKFLTKKQILLILTKCSERCKKSESIKLINQAIVLNNSVVLNSRTLTNLVTADDSLIKELVNLVQNYVA